MPTSHRIELTPLQSLALRADGMIGATAGAEVYKLKNEIDEIQGRIVAIYEESNKVHKQCLREIAREHALESIPVDAEVDDSGSALVLSWEEADVEPPPEDPKVPSVDQSQGSEIDSSSDDQSDLSADGTST